MRKDILRAHMNTSSPTFRLFKRPPTFIGGMGSIMDLSSNSLNYNLDATEADADYKSLAADWTAVGNDLTHAISEYGKEQEK